MTLFAAGCRPLEAEISNAMPWPPKHYFEEIARLKALADESAPVEIDGETAYLKNYSATTVLCDQAIFWTEYVVPAHNGRITQRGVCTPTKIEYEPPTFSAPPYTARAFDPLPIKYRRTPL